MEAMTKNEIVARWVNPSISDLHLQKCDLSFDYNLLHEAWVKFRDLKFDIGLTDFHIHESLCREIAHKISYGIITEAFDELVKGIEWYNSLNKEK